MKKIMIFIGGYFPGEKYGGPVTSIYNFTEMLGDVYELRIICCNHDFGDTKPYESIQEGWNKIGKAQVLYLPDKECNGARFNQVLKQGMPDVIYASGIMHFKFNAPIICEAKKLGIPVLLAPRGDICENALRIKAWKKIPFLKIIKAVGFFSDVYFHATMQEEVDNLVRYLNVSPERIYNLPNLPSSAVHKKNYKKEAGFIRILFVSRIQSKKNLLTAIRIVNKMKGKAIFDIYGPIENESYWAECKQEIQKAPKEIAITYKGALAPEEAKNIYLQYDCFLFPTLSENYGHVIAESLLHDCPVVISKGTTPWDGVTTENAGAAYLLTDIRGFVEYLEFLQKMDDAAYQQLLEHLHDYVDKKILFSKLKNQFIDMLEAVTKKA